MKLRTKILSGFLILVLMLFVAGLWSVYHFNFIGQEVQTILDDNYKSVNAAMSMVEALEREDSAILMLVLGNWETGRQGLKAADSAFQSAFNIVRYNITEPDEPRIMQLIEARYTEFKAQFERPIVGTAREQNLSWYQDSVHGAFSAVKQAVYELIEINDQGMYRTATELKNQANRATMPGIIAIISALLFTVIFSYFMHRFMIRPIMQIETAVRQFTESGELPKLNIRSEDEIAQLANSINNLCAQVKTK